MTAFTKIEGVDTELAEKLVEQGILSYDDLSVMEISDLVNTIEGLTEEQTIEIVARAEQFAEEQADDMPRRKGARTGPSTAESSSNEPESSEGDEIAATSHAEAEATGSEGAEEKPTLDELFGSDDNGDADAETGSGEGRDVDMALEESVAKHDGEISSPPSNAELEETERIYNGTAGAGEEEVEAPSLPLDEPFSEPPLEERDPETY